VLWPQGALVADAPAPQFCRVQVWPGDVQIPQVALQHTSPGAHVVVPHTTRGGGGGFDGGAEVATTGTMLGGAEEGGGGAAEALSATGSRIDADVATGTNRRGESSELPAAIGGEGLSACEGGQLFDVAGAWVTKGSRARLGGEASVSGVRFGVVTSNQVAANSGSGASRPNAIATTTGETREGRAMVIRLLPAPFRGVLDRRCQVRKR